MEVKIHYDARGYSNPFCGQTGYALKTSTDLLEITCQRCIKKVAGTNRFLWDLVLVEKRRSSK